ncbi:ribonuclease E inhibitor RraB [Aquimarina algiphila]|uniref:Ribonuclease E inhibitor RraB n=2 Tax=Aquimarina algiphila TaxID=2047982 RepID=A0A554VA89_9FLAO|nr:ribonuclease E inhibitor RraB [Aquimarina algiphila]
MMITKEIIEDFFENLDKGGEFDTSSKLLWGYFFLDKNKSKLKIAAEKLSKLGYQYVDIFEAEKENPNDSEEYYLHVERIEYHDVNSLDQRNKDFYLFAKNNNLDCYDGFDAGNIITSENVIK